MGNFAYYLALYGGFNYISKERDEDRDIPRSYYLIDDSPNAIENQYLNDIKELSKDGWVIILIASDSVHDEALHFVTAIQPKLNAGKSTVIDTEAFDRLFSKVSEDMEKDFGLKSERDVRYLPVGKKNVAMRIGGGTDLNVFTLRIDWNVPAFDDRHIAIADRLAKDIASVISPDAPTSPDPKWKETGFGY